MSGREPGGGRLQGVAFFFSPLDQIEQRVLGYRSCDSPLEYSRRDMLLPAYLPQSHI